MAQTGKQLAVDLNDLMAIGHVDLPLLAYAYAEMNTAIADYPTDDVAFGSPGGGGRDAVGAAWVPLRDQLQNILGNTSLALMDASRTIPHVEAAYEATDTEARNQISDTWSLGPPPGTLLQTEQLPPGAPPPVKLAGGNR